MDISKLKKSVAGFTIFALLTTFVSFAGIAQASTDYDDVDSDNYAYDAIMYLQDEGIMTGDSDANTFRPTDNISRAEVAATLVRTFAELDEEYDHGFTDLAGDWSDDWVDTAALYEFMTGDSGLNTFRPTEYIARSEAAKAVVNAAALETVDSEVYEMPFDDVMDDWTFDPINTAYWYQVVNGKDANTFSPDEYILRQDFALVVYNSLSPEMREMDEEEEEEESTADTTLEVTLSDDTPAGDSLPNGAVSVPMASWDFEADGGDVEVDGLVVHQYAISDMESDSAYYLYNGSERLTSSKTINSTSREITFNNLNVEVEEGETVTLTLRMNVGTPTASIEAGFEIEAADAVTSDAGEVEMDGSLQGEKFTLASTPAAGTITIEKNGTVSNVSIGADEATVAKFKLSPSNEAAWVQEIGLYVTGTVSVDDLSNFQLYRTGYSDEVIATADSVDSNDVVRFVLDGDYENDDTECDSDDIWGYCLNKSTTRTFYVTADFNTGRTGDSVKLYVDEDTDLVAIGDTYSYGMDVTRTAYDGGSCTTTGGECAYFDLEGGDITFSKTDYSSTTVATNTNDVAIMNFTIAASSDVTFDNFVLQLQAASGGATAASLLNSATANYTDIKVTSTDGSFVMGPIESDDLLYGTVGSGSAVDEDNDDVATHYIFTDDFEIAAGDEMEFVVTVDIEDNDSLDQDTLTAGIYIDTTYPTVKDSNSKTLTNADVLSPVSTYTGQAFTLTTNSLSVIRDADYDDETIVLGSEDVELAGFIFSAGAAGDVTISDLTFAAYGGDDSSSPLTLGGETYAFNQMIQHVDLYVDSVAEENKLNTTSKESSAAGVINFENLDWTIEAGSSTTLIVVGDTPVNDNYESSAVKVDITTASTDIVAVDDEGTTVSAEGDAVQGGTDEAIGTLISLIGGGTLAVDIPSSTPVSEIAGAGTTGHEFAYFEFTATNEEMNVSSLVLRNAYGTTAGDYDDNLDTVSVEYYTDAEQTVSDSAVCDSLSGGYYYCDLETPMVVPNETVLPGETAIMTVVANMSSTALSKADSGDLPALTLALYEYDTTRKFVAEGADSGRDIEASATYDLAITDVTTAGFSNALTGYENLQTQAAISSTTATTIYLEDEVPGDPGDLDMVGGFLCLSDNDDTTCDSDEEIVYVVAVTDGASYDTLTVVRGVDGTTPATMPIDTTVLALAPSSALATNAMYVYETDLALTASTTRTGSQAASETIMSLTVADEGSGKGYIRTGLNETMEADVTHVAADDGQVVAATTYAMQGTNGVALLSLLDADISDNDGFLKAMTSGAADDYAYVDLWVKWNSQDDADANLSKNVVEFVVNDDTTDWTSAKTVDLASSGEFVEGRWYLVTVDLSDLSSAADSGDTYFGLRITDADDGGAGGFQDDGDYIALDNVVFYNDALNVDLATNADWTSVTPTLAYLKDGSGNTKASAYVDFDGVASSRTGQIRFVPYTTQIEFSGTATYSIQMNTSAAITNTTATETITATIDLGAVGTAGDLLWYDNTNAVTFCGVQSDDFIYTTSSY